MTRTCPCGQPTREASYLCSSCTTQLWNTLDAIPDLVVDLDLTRTRQRSYSTSAGIAAGDSLPWHEAASRSLGDLRRITDRAVDRCIGAQIRSTERVETGPRPASRALDDVARWLQVRVDAIATRPWAPQVRDLIAAHEHALDVIDRPPEHTYAGPCQVCGADLNTLPDSPTVRCQVCGTVEDVARRRSFLLEVVNDHLATATEIARALTSLAMPVTSERIRQWKHRDRLQARAHDHRTGHPLYRIGDVIDLLVADSERLAS